MGREWTQARLGDVTLNHDARRVPIRGSERKQGPFPYYGASGIVDYVDDYLFDGEYLLIAEDGENLRTRQTPYAFLAKGKFWVNNHAHIISGSAKASTRFVHYALQEHDISTQLTGAVMPKLTQSSLNAIPLLLPSPAEQTAISDLLSALDDKITLNGKMSATLEGIARTLFQSWFVDFDPVRRAAAGEDTGLLAHIAALFPARLDDDGLPKGWARGALSQIADVQRDKLEPASLEGRAVLHFSLPAYDAGQRPIAEQASAIKSLKLVVRRGTILFSKLNPQTPRVWIIPEGGELLMLASTEFIAMRPSQSVPISYLWSLLSSPALQARAAAMVTGTSRSHQRVQPSAFLATEWPVPPSPVLAAFDKIVAPLMLRIETLHAESSTLASLRDTLLPKLISGELRIRETEIILESA